MEISENTLSILKNFATINAGIFIEAGAKQLKTKSIGGGIYAKVSIPEDFPVDIAIYDLNEFLSVISLMDSPLFEFQEKSVTITDGKNQRASIEYRYAKPELISYPKSDINIEEFDVRFKMEDESLAKVMKASSLLVVEDMSLSNLVQQNKVTVKVLDANSSSSNVFAIDVGECDVSATYDFHFKSENIKILPGNYKVGLSSKLISHFFNEDLKIEYYVAIEKSSTFTEA